MLVDNGVSEEIQKQYLTIIGGDIRDEPAIRKTLLRDDGLAHRMIVFGVGGYPSFRPNPFRPTLDDPTLTESGVKAIKAVLQSIGNKPLLLVISTTGVDEKNDVPFLLKPLYHQCVWDGTRKLAIDAVC